MHGPIPTLVALVLAAGLLGCEDKGPSAGFPMPTGKRPSDADGGGRSDGGAGDGDGSSQGVDAGVAEQRATRSIEAARGGEVCTPDGVVCLRIAPGSLAADTVVGVARVDGPRGSHAWGFEIEPQGLVFDPPAELVVNRYAFVDPVAWLSPRFKERRADCKLTWCIVDGPRERTEGDLMLLAIEATGTYGLSSELVRLPSRCPVTPSTFSACGGDPTGDWVLEGYCYESFVSVLYEHPGGPSNCEFDPSYAGGGPAGNDLNVAPLTEWPIGAQLQVTQDRFIRGEATATIPVVTTLAADCQNGIDGCAYGSALGGGTFQCTGTASCECTFTPPSALQALDAAYRIDAAALEIDGEAATDFCVADGSLRVHHAGGVRPYVAIYTR